MDAELMAKLVELGPIGLAIAAFMLLGKEVVKVLVAPRADRSIESGARQFADLLTRNNDQLGRNLVLFEKTNQHLENIEDRLGVNNSLLQQMLTEMARGRR